MYYIYHIPDFVYKDDTKGKIGCTDNIEARIKRNNWLSKQPFNFWEVLETYDCIDTASKREIELQKKYGYKVDKILYSQSIKTSTTKSCSKGGKIGGKISGTKNVQTGHWKMIIELAAQKKRKPVLQYDLDGNFIAEWPSIRKAANKLGLHSANICHACKGNLRKCGGFMWKFKESKKINKKIKPYIFVRKDMKPVLQYDLDGNFIAEYKSGREARSTYGGGVQQALAGKQKKAYGFIWKYKENNLDN